jgi:hypothetical protein
VPVHDLSVLCTWSSSAQDMAIESSEYTGHATSFGLACPVVLESYKQVDAASTASGDDGEDDQPWVLIALYKPDN